VRMYAMVITLSLWGALAAYALLRTVLTPVLLRRRAAIYGILFMLCMYVGYLAHVETILILPGIALATLIEWSRIEYRARTRTEERGVRTRVRLIVCASACIGVVALVSIFITDNVLSDRLGQVRSRFNTPYLLHPFNGFRWPIGALVLWIVYSVVAIRSRSVRFFSVIAAVVIVILLVYVKRYDAERYIIFIVPYIILAFTMSMAYIFKRWPMWGGFALVLWLVVCVPFHISALTPPQSTHWYSFDSAYSAVRLNAAPTDVIYTVDFRSYYWQNDPDRKIIELGHDKVLTLDEFIESVKRNGNGFLILPQGKAHHVRKEIREYCNTHFEHESMNNILIYTIR
ncbi:MAG: hypothetical protein KIH62_002630, partial [Candidatus Kerfeldbacteria bacterium]|nr:hypothetical protein [Candidatus Kerfeldbacteria bacterium]